MNVYTSASSTLNASCVGTMINTAGTLFYVRIVEEIMSFGVYVFSRKVFIIFGHVLYPLVLLMVRYICDGGGLACTSLKFS